MRNYTFLILFAIFAAGCSQRLVDFTVVSTKNVDWSRAQSFTRAKSRAEGKDTAHIIIFIPTGIPNMKEAIDRAIESVPGAVALVDGVLYNKTFYIPLIYGQNSYVIEGTPLIDPELTKAEFESSYMIARLDNRGSLADFRYVTQQEYGIVREKLLPQVE